MSPEGWFLMYDVAVIGAGVVGALAARELTRYQLRVLLLEKADDVAMGASKANSAIVHAGFDCVPGTRMAEMNVKGNAMMAQVAKELSVPFKQNGSMVAAFGEADEAVLRDLKDRGEKNGVPGLAIVSGDEARALEPKLSPDVTAALVAPTGGIVCPYELTIAAAGNAMDNGATLLCNFAVTGASFSDGHWTLSAADGRTAEARYIVTAAGMGSDIIPPVKVDGVTVSSTRIRALVSEGDMAGAERLLGHPHELSDIVRSGYKLGRRMGTPTINMHIPEHVIVPRYGVYATRVFFDGEEHTAVTNVGVRPTFANGNTASVESYILDYSGNLYGKRVRVEFYTFIRPERRFDCPEALRAQILTDECAVREYFKSR